MTAGIEQLRDIRGLDTIPWWPPALGWWLLAGTILCLLAVAIAYRRRRRARLSDWRPEAWELLLGLRRRAGEEDQHALAGELSELLRRIAMARFGRRACAGLMQEQWLGWLEEHDPNGFEWRTKGRPLIEWPYAPVVAPADQESLEALIDAVEGWVKPSRRKDRGRDKATSIRALPSAAAVGPRRQPLAGGQPGC